MLSDRDRVVYLQVSRPPVETLAQFALASVASVHQAGGGALLNRSIHPRLPGARVAGSALTCECAPGDNLTLHRAITLCGEHDVLVAVANDDSVAVWGGLMSLAAHMRGAVGAIIDGLVRDTAIMRELGFPVWSRDVSAAGPAQARFGQVNVPVVCGGRLVNPGDIVVADDDGVAVVSRLDAERALAKVQERERREQEWRRRMIEGETLYSLLELESIVSQAGVREVRLTWDAVGQE